MSEGGRLALNALARRQLSISNGWLAIVPLADVPVDELYPIDAGGHPLVLVREGNKVYALDGRCPHRGGPMNEGVLEGHTIRCPWHHFSFDVRTGEIVWPQGWEGLPTYATRIREGMVELAID